jgi:hypothetical protein
MNHETGMSAYNIDRLRLPNVDWEFRLANRHEVRKALELEHVTHLQRYDRTVAMRRSVIPAEKAKPGYRQRPDKVLYTVTFAASHIDQQVSSLEKAVDIVMDFLNQGEHEYAEHDSLEVWCNQGKREATVLAVLGSDILIEVEMPGTTSQWGYNRRTGQYRHPARPTTFLCVYNAGLGDLRTKRNISYTKVPKKWLAEMRSNNMDWIGNGQRANEPVPFPRTLSQSIGR